MKFSNKNNDKRINFPIRTVNNSAKFQPRTVFIYAGTFYKH